MVFIKNLLLISLISLEKNDAPSCTEAPLPEREDGGGSALPVPRCAVPVLRGVAGGAGVGSHLLHTCAAALLALRRSHGQPAPLLF